ELWAVMYQLSANRLKPTPNSGEDFSICNPSNQASMRSSAERSLLDISRPPTTAMAPSTAEPPTPITTIDLKVPSLSRMYNATIAAIPTKAPRDLDRMMAYNMIDAGTPTTNRLRKKAPLRRNQTSMGSAMTSA